MMAVGYKKNRGARFVTVLLALYSPFCFAKESPSANQIRQLLIKQSIQSYPGNCPCPYNLARNGGRCGGRSAYSRPGGYSPLCFPADISDAMVDRYRKQ